LAKPRHIAIATPGMEKSAGPLAETSGIERANLATTPCGAGLPLSNDVVFHISRIG